MAKPENVRRRSRDDKLIKCEDLFPGCDAEVRAESEEEVLRLAAEHAKRTHGLAEVDEATAGRVRAAIKDESAAT